MFSSFVEQLAALLASAYPQASSSQCKQVAYALFCLSQTNESMIQLGFDLAYNSAARTSAEQLLQSLATAPALMDGL